MPTIAAGNSAEVYVPLASRITVTAGQNGFARFACSSPRDSAPAPKTVWSIETFDVPAGSTMFIEAVRDAVEYTDVKLDEAAGSLPAIARSYRLATMGDSRSRLNTSGTQIGVIGSSANYTSQRPAPWIAAYLGDTDPVADFGVSGDTLISASTSTGWNGTARSNSKTIANLIATGVDAVYIQYGINDLPSASSANLIAAAKSLVSELVAAGIKVCLSNIMIFDPTAGSANISPANAPATLVKINAFRDSMREFIAGLTGRAVFVDPNPLLILPSTGYGDPQYFTTADALGVHPNENGAQIMGRQAAEALRTLLPKRYAHAFTPGPLYQPNLIDWGGSSNLFAANNVVGTTTASTPTWGVDSVTGVPYCECTFTVTALSSGTAQARFEAHATGISGATPTWPIAIGDVLQGSARVTIDDGSGNPVKTQSITLRHRMFNTSAASQFFADWGGTSGTSDLSLLAFPVDGRFSTPMQASPIASADIAAASVGSGYYLAVLLEAPALGTYRVRMYAPSLRVVSKPATFTITPGASPYVYQNNPRPFVLNDFVNTAGQSLMVTVAGGTVSQIAIGRGATSSGSFLNAVNTGATSGAFILGPGDGLVVTYSSTPTMTGTIL